MTGPDGYGYGEPLGPVLTVVAWICVVALVCAPALALYLIVR